MPNTVTNEKIISATYVALFQRSPDQAGFKYWSDKAAELQLAGKTGNDLAKEMANLFVLHPAFTSLYGALGDAAYIDAIYMNIGGKVADANGRAFWLGKLTDATNPLSRAELVGEFVYTILSITPEELQAQKEAGSITEQELADALARQDRLNNKSDVALKFTQAMGAGSNLSLTPEEANDLALLNKDPAFLASKAIINGVTEDDATMTAPNNYLNGTPTIKGINETFGDGANDGKTLMLTKGLDNFTPTSSGISQTTSGDDLIIGSIDDSNGELNTLSSLDVINGGAGTDTLKIAHGGTGSGAVTTGNLSNVEVVQIESANSSGVTVSTATVTGVTNLNITKAAGTVQATAAATTDVSLTVKENGAGSKLAHSIVGGKNVTVTATEMGTTAASGDTITIGSGTAPKGDVVVNLTGAKYAGGSPAFGSGDTVVINGGKTVTVTQVASSDSSFAATSAANSGSGVTQANVKVTANADTTTINVKQDVATAKNATATTGGVTETATVKFGALKANNTLEMNLDGSSGSGLKLTAVEDMTAEQVAQAFANLVAKSNHLNASGTAVVANGDTQGSLAYTKGTYSLDSSTTGTSGSLWSSAAASGDTVVFTAATANTPVTDLAFTASGSGSNAPVVTTTQGKLHDATFTGGVMGAIAGKVTIDGTSGAALKTITIDGFGASSATSGTTALETLNLSNSAGNAFTVGNAAATLNLNLEKVTDASGSTGSGVTISSGAATLNVKSVGNNVLTAADATTVLNVSGNGILTGGASGDLDTIKTITVSETAGLNFAAAGSGLTALESVNTTATTGTVIINIAGTATYTGGSGVDIVTVTNPSGTGIGKAIDLGAGNDTLILNGTGTTTPTVDIKGGDGDADTLSMTAATAATIGAGFMAKVTGFERLTLKDQANTTGGAVTVQLKDLGFTSYVTTNGYSGNNNLVLNNLADNATVVLAGVGTGGGAIEAKIEGASGSTTNVLNVIGTTATGDLTAGKLVANEVETINLTATDTAPTNASGVADIQTITLALAADKATAVNLGTSNANLTLTLDSTTSKLATVDGNAMTGNLTVNLTAHNGVAMTVKGGAGADVLSASAGANAKADVLNGGAGNDVLVAGTNGAKLTGGEGNDLFVLMDSAASGVALAGNKTANTFSTIEEFQAGDVLQLLWNSGDSSGKASSADKAVTSFTKLTANVQGTTDPSAYANAAIDQLAQGSGYSGGGAVWFTIGNDSYVVVDNGVAAAVASGATAALFTNSEDLIIKLTGVDLTNASFNTTFGTITL